MKKQRGQSTINLLLLAFLVVAISLSLMEMSNYSILSLDFLKKNTIDNANIYSMFNHLNSEFKKEGTYGDSFLTECSNYNGYKKVESTLNEVIVEGCFKDIDYERKYIGIDVDLDGNIDFNKLIKRKVEIISISNKKELLSILEIDINETGTITTTVLSQKEK